MSQPPEVLTIDVGGCEGWTLQRADSTTTTSIRPVDGDEVERIDRAVEFCRRYVISPPYRLLTSSHRVWQQTYARAIEVEREDFNPSLTEDLLGALVGWLLIWRLTLDQAAHDLSERFGRESVQLASFRAATRAAYDSSQAYRIVEALRNIVQHREMPPILLTRSNRLDVASGLPVAVTLCKFPASYLLRSPKCPATVRAELSLTPNAEFELSNVVDDAMTAMMTVLLELARISVPEMIEHVRYLRMLFSETDPVPPLLLRVLRPTADDTVGGFDVQMKHLLDLAYVVQNAPLGQ